MEASHRRPRALCLLLPWLVAALAASPTMAVEAARPAKDARAGARAARERIVRTILLDHFCFGAEAPAAWQSEVREANGARFDFTLGYLSTGVGHGDTPWFLKYGGLSARIAEAKQLNMGCWFTWYMLSQSMPADWKPGPAQASPANAKVASTMRAYFDCFKTVMIECGKHPEVAIVMQIEPDEWCHLLISGHMDPAQVEVKVGSCGLEELTGLSDDLYGYARALVRLRDAYAPTTLLACNPSAWDNHGSMSGQNLGRTFKAMCCPDYDLAAFETGDRDKGMAGAPPPYGDGDQICATIPEHIGWVKDFHEATGLWVCLWQVAAGNTWFATCDNSKFHYCDNLAQYLLEDYPRNDAIARYAAAGCCACLFNGCIPGYTAVWDLAKDGITNPQPIPGNAGHRSEYADDDGGYVRLRAGAYYRRPYPILGKRSAKPAAAEAARAGETPHSAPAAARTVATASVDAQTRKSFDSILQRRLGEELAANRHPAFTPAALGALAALEGVQGGMLTVRLQEGGQMDLPWATLAVSDCSQLARFLVRENHPEDHALVAFYLLLEGSAAAAEQQLGLAGAAAAAVRRAFALE